eukprot:TRINITY_DN8620_c0_g3_i1.p1 TRINITY_DN8620_c0_g3~~TRINITY_DN8620_c0_g3_i1.p1  ORF type:complete len:423 (+),score=59.27 TRINITY_DN8620_c0_g3_i1:140-1270(+)
MVTSSRSGYCLKENACCSSAKRSVVLDDQSGRHPRRDDALPLAERACACDGENRCSASSEDFERLWSRSICCESSEPIDDVDQESASGSESGIDDSLLANHASNIMSPFPGAGSCSSSLVSSKAWFKREETVVFLDFDDTIFPSTWLAHVASIKSLCTRASIEALRAKNSDAIADLARHEAVVISFLRAVAALSAEVVIVTLGTPEWVEGCMKIVMPQLMDELFQLNISISYAREAGFGRKVRGAILEGMDALPILKRESMRKTLMQFYSKRPKQSWKNCISIGDSLAERHALEELTFTRLQCSDSGKQKVVRCKTIKFVSSPSVRDLTSEIELMISYISALVHYDGDFSYDIQENDDREAMQLHESLAHGTSAHV